MAHDRESRWSVVGAPAPAGVTGGLASGSGTSGVCEAPPPGADAPRLEELEAPPDDRTLTRPERLIRVAGEWFVVHTRSRNEKRVAQALDRNGVGYYLPLVAVERTYEKSSFSFDLPLFPCYLFLRGNHDGCDVARKTNRVASILRVKDQQRLEGELIHIGRAIGSRNAVELFPGIRTGRRYRITRGPLRDIEGVVVRRGRRLHMCLSVTILGQSALVEVEAALLASAD